jgi:hypothetical protein
LQLKFYPNNRPVLPQKANRKVNIEYSFLFYLFIKKFEEVILSTGHYSFTYRNIEKFQSARYDKIEQIIMFLPRKVARAACFIQEESSGG